MKTRIITSVAALAVFFGVLFIPKYCFPSAQDAVFWTAIACVACMMVSECLGAAKASRAVKITEIICALIIIAAAAPFRAGGDFAVTAKLCAAAVMFVVLLNMALVVALHGKMEYKDVLSAAFLAVYIAASCACIVINKTFFGLKYTLLIFICAWSTDTFAYFTGRLIGMHKLIPHVSPNKTVEGAAGGVLGAAICCTLYLFAVSRIFDPNVPFLAAGITVGMVGGVFSQIGDLAASAVKRDTGVKDFGWIFPGHGGFMDRFDSVIFIAPLVTAALWAVVEMWK